MLDEIMDFLFRSFCFIFSLLSCIMVLSCLIAMVVILVKSMIGG